MFKRRKEKKRLKKDLKHDRDLATYKSAIQAVLNNMKNIKPPVYEKTNLKRDYIDNNIVFPHTYGSDPCPIDKNILFPYNRYVTCNNKNLEILRKCYLKRLVTKLNFNNELFKIAKILETIVELIKQKYTKISFHYVGSFYKKEFIELDKQIGIFHEHYIAQIEIEEWIKMCEANNRNIVNNQEWDKKRRLSKKAFNDSLINRDRNIYYRNKTRTISHKAPKESKFKFSDLIEEKYKSEIQQLLTA